MKEDPTKWIKSSVSSNLYDSLIAYRKKLQQWNKKFSLTSVDDPEIFALLIAPSAWLGIAYSKIDLGIVADFGSGAGIPGVPMAIVDPRNRYILVEASDKKSAFLKACVSDPNINVNGNISVVNQRLLPGTWEDKAGALVSRGAGSLVELANLWSGKLSAEVRMDVYKGDNWEREKSELSVIFPGLKIEKVDVPTWFGSLQIVNIQGDMSRDRP